MGDRVCVLKDGLLQQVDTPLGLYDNPANLFVAGFIGSPAMNLLGAQMTDRGASVNGSELPLAISPEDRRGHDGNITVGVRPEDFRVSDNNTGVPVKVTLVEELGADAFVYGEVADHNDGGSIGSGTPVVVRVEARRRFEKGSTIHVTADPKEIHVFDTSTGERIGKRVGLSSSGSVPQSAGTRGASPSGATSA
jgi:multiple sugar transport system ATP-binding protein